MVNRLYFTEVGRKGVPKMNPYSKEYLDFWTEERKRCLEGYTVGDITMPGRLYFYVNYWTIELNKNNAPRKTRGRPELRDIEWEIVNLFEKAKAEHKGVIIVAGRGPGKCMAAGTEIVMFDGNLKKIEDINIGDIVAGPNGSQEVVSTYCGYDDMYEIQQNKGIHYIVNSEHLISLQRNSLVPGLKNGKQYTRYKEYKDIADISCKELIKKSKKFLSSYSGYKRFCEFTKKKIDIDPYFLGVWLGDGTECRAEVTSVDKEIINAIYEQAFNEGLAVHKSKSTLRTTSYKVVNEIAPKYNSLLNKLRRYDLLKNKHIPIDYKGNSREIRLNLLAGLIDTDGYLQDGCYEIIQKRKTLIEDIKFVADSLGFKTSLRSCVKTIKSINFKGIYYRLTISGNVNEIPVRINRKKILNKNPNKDHRITRLNGIKYCGYSKYYGFTLKDSPYYFLKDFTVCHNTFATAGMAVGYEYTFFKDNEAVISAYETKYSSKLLGHIKLGLDNLPGDEEVNNEFFPSPFYHHRLKDDWTKEVRSGYKINMQGTWKVAGYNSRILHRVYMDDHAAANGTRPSVHVLEEAGLWPNLITSYNSSIECWMDGTVQFGMPILIGTGGDMDSGGSIDLQKMFYDPETYNLLAFEDRYEHKGKIGYFIPATKGLNQFKDEQGMTIEDKAKEYLHRRRDIKKKGKDKQAYYQELQYQPFIPSEAFLITKGNVFPIQALQEQVAFIETHKEAKYLGDIGRLELDKEGYPIWLPDDALQPCEYPPTHNKTGAIVIWEHPKSNPAYGLYIAGTDPYQQDDSSTGSLGSTIIYKRFQSMEETYDWPVAEYTARPDTLHDYYENVRRLLLYYNAQTLYENNIRGLKEYLEVKNCLYLLKTQPHSIKDIIPDSVVERGYGVHMTKQIKQYCELKIRDWLTTEYAPGKMNLTKIYSVPLLRELIAYNEDGNFDRFIAFALCILHDLDIFKINAEQVMQTIDEYFTRKLFKRAYHA